MRVEIKPHDVNYDVLHTDGGNHAVEMEYHDEEVRGRRTLFTGIVYPIADHY